MTLKPHFSRFLASNPGHFSAHSHHPWPDASFAAQQQAWLDAASMADRKWDKVLDEVLPAAQRHVARLLNLPDPRTLCFAPNTHELFMRLLSSFPLRPLRVLTTGSEFHSFARQMRRLEEASAALVTRVPVEPYDTFAQRFAERAASGRHDVAYFSQVFYDSGFRVADLTALVGALPSGATVVIDGYHGFMAVPTDLSGIAERAFYLAGGYKYAMAGEGACFMHCPPGLAPRPVDTGWFASFEALDGAEDTGPVAYGPGGQRFMGATFDPTSLYRLTAVQDWLLREGITVEAIRRHVERLQARFLALRAERGLLPGSELLPPANQPRGNFLAFRSPLAPRWHGALLDAGILTDCRGDRLRIGFGIYQDEGDVEQFAARAAALPHV